MPGNLRRHVAVLEQARADGCEIAVFPELSLTGSTDPVRRPERAVPIDAEPVQALVAATWRTGVAAVFGIAERAGAAFHITQVYAHGGRLGGAYRKRHLGEGEEAYRAGAGGGVLALGRPASAWPSARRAAWTSRGPRLAALVSPAGEVVRLPDWRPGTLTVEVPVDVTVQPVREAVRCLVVDGAGRALLVRFADAGTGATWWAPPGGGLQSGEDHLAAAHRELREELDRDGFRIGPWIGRRTHTFWWGRWMTQRERWVAVPRRAVRGRRRPRRVAVGGEHPGGALVVGWGAALVGVVTTPRDLAGLLDGIAGGRLPDADADLGG